jgi:hypothetical protein
MMYEPTFCPLPRPDSNHPAAFRAAQAQGGAKGDRGTRKEAECQDASST